MSNISTDIWSVVANHHGVDAHGSTTSSGRADQLRPRRGLRRDCPASHTSGSLRDLLTAFPRPEDSDPEGSPAPRTPVARRSSYLRHRSRPLPDCNRANCRLDPRVNAPPCLAEFHSGLLLLTLSLNVAWLGQARLLYQFHQLAVDSPENESRDRTTHGSDLTVQSVVLPAASSPPTRTSLSSPAPRGKIA